MRKPVGIKPLTTSEAGTALSPGGVGLPDGAVDDKLDVMLHLCLHDSLESGLVQLEWVEGGVVGPSGHAAIWSQGFDSTRSP